MKGKLRTVLLIFFCLLFLISGGMVVYQFSQYSTGDEAYQEAEALVSLPVLPDVPTDAPEEQPTAPSENGSAASSAQEKPAYVDPYADALADMDFSALQEINRDVLGWILIPGTKISYPMVQGSDNDYYLKHTWKKTSSAVGAIFLDTRCSKDFSGFNTIVYGHRMNNGSMFAGLKYYKKQSYLKSHSTVYVTTAAGSHQYQIFSVYEGDPAGFSYRTSFSSAEKKQAFLDAAVGASLYDTGVTPTVNDSIVTLSTCTGNGHAKRLIVHALRRGAAPTEETEAPETVPEAVPDTGAATALPEEQPTAPDAAETVSPALPTAENTPATTEEVFP